MENGHAHPPGDDPNVTVRLDDIADLARCPICMGIMKETRTISVCMHRFCRPCIEAWLRTNRDNTCPQCRESFASRRNCKPDPSFDQLLGAIFGRNTAAADDAFLEPPSAALAAAKAMGSELMILRETQRLAAQKAAAQAAAHARVANMAARNAGGGSGGSGSMDLSGEYDLVSEDDGDEGYEYGPSGKKHMKRPASSSALDGSNKSKRSKGGGGGHGKSHLGGSAASLGSGELPHELSSPKDGPGIASSKYYGVRHHVPNNSSTAVGSWLAYAYDGTRGGVPSYTPLGQYSTEEDAARIYDLHKVRSKGGKSSVKLNFPYLVQVYQKLLSHGVAPSGTEREYEGAVQRVNAAVQGVTAPHGWKPPLLLPRPKSGAGGGGGSSRPESSAGGGGGKGGRPPKAKTAAAAAVAVHVTPSTEYVVSVEEQLLHEAVANAKQLAEMFPSAAMLGPLSRNPSTALVEIRPAEGVAAENTWNMKSMACPANATIAELALAIAEGISAMKISTKKKNDDDNDGDGGGSSPTSSGSGGVSAAAVQLNAANELDASADFMAVYNDIDNAGSFALKTHLTVRSLMLMLADGGEDLVLEYSIKE